MKGPLGWLIVFAVATTFGCGGGEEEAPATIPEQVSAPPETPAPTTTAVDTVPSPQVTPPPRPTVQRDTRGRYTVQVSSWRTRRKADSEAEKLRERGYDAYVQRVVLDNQETWYRVRVGSFATIEEARQFAETLGDLLESGYWVDRLRGEG